MQRGKNMTQIVKFVYVIIIFLSLFHAARNDDYHLKCTTDYDCREGFCPEGLAPKCFVSFALARFLSEGRCLCI